MYSDFHLHTAFSDDSDYAMQSSIEQAIALGLEEIGYAEHLDYGIDNVDQCDIPLYLETIVDYQKKYKDQIVIRQGVEFGIQAHTISEYQKTFDAYPFDFVILSIHQINNQEFWRNEYQEGKPRGAILEGYYDELFSVLSQYNDYSFLGHVDVINRYVERGPYLTPRNRDQIAEIFKHIIEKGRGIEVNTSCYRYGLKDLTPSREIIRLYRELGGEIITIGSDGHNQEELGFKILETQNELREMGFKAIYTFKEMMPVGHLL